MRDEKEEEKKKEKEDLQQYLSKVRGLEQETCGGKGNSYVVAVKGPHQELVEVY